MRDIRISVIEHISVADKISEQVRNIVNKVINSFKLAEKVVKNTIDILLSTPTRLARPPTFEKLTLFVKPPMMAKLSL